MATERKKKIFVSYNYLDSDFANKIIMSLENRGIEVYKDSKLQPGDYWLNQIQYHFELSDMVLVVLSFNTLKEGVSSDELRQLFKIAENRKISIIPVHIDNSPIPLILFNYQVINLTRNYEKGIESIIDKLIILPEINFNKFTNHNFQQFVYDFLKEYRFKNLTWQYSDHFDFGYDLSASYENKDPFGNKIIETWLIEIKYYSEDRFSINSINQLINNFQNIKEKNKNLLLITNSILTSISEDYLNEIKGNQNLPITIIDGNALKKLIIKKKKLVNQYFTIWAR